MQPSPAVLLPQLFDDAGVEAMVRLAERFGPHGLYSQEVVGSVVGDGLPQRVDAVLNYLKGGGFHGLGADDPHLASRTNYFRESYAYGQDELVEGVGRFLHHEAFVEAARSIFGLDVVEPAIVFANLMVPGQELAVHTDVPEFRGCNRKVMPQWLLVAMHHSGLFEAHRMPIATAVAWFHDGGEAMAASAPLPRKGGDFVFWPDGAEGEAVPHAVHRGAAIVLDTDSVFHGVDRVASTVDEIPPLTPGMAMHPDGAGRWEVADGERRVAGYHWDELRFSVSWKAYCFADRTERDAWLHHADDLTMDRVLAVLIGDLVERGVVAADVEVGPRLGRTIIDTYIHFPAPAPVTA